MKKVLLYFLFIICINKLKAFEAPFFIPNQGQLTYSHQTNTNDILYYNNLGDVKILFKKDRITYIFEKSNYEKFLYWRAVADTNMKMAELLQQNDSTYYYRMDMVFLDANPDVTLEQANISSTYYNYILPQTPNGLKVFPSSKLIYKNIYPGIDIVFFQQKGKLKYDIIISPNADPSLVKLKFDGANLELISSSEIKVITPLNEWSEIYT